MYSSTAYEAFYTYIGLYLHEAAIKIITSQEVLFGILFLTFGCLFLFSAWGYFKRFLPGTIGGGQGKSLGVFVKLLVCFILGVSLLKFDTPSEVKNYKRISWHDNKYITFRSPNVQSDYQVSFLFDLMTRSAEEIAKLASHIVDKLFQKTNSNLEAPDAFYKAVMYSSSQTIDDPRLRALIDLYTSQCFDKILPLVGEMKRMDKIDEFFKENGAINSELREIPVHTSGGLTLNCLDVKNKVREDLLTFAATKNRNVSWYKNELLGENKNFFEKGNILASNALLRHYMNKTESDALGVEKGAEVKTGLYGKFLLAWKRFWNGGHFKFFGAESAEGAHLTAERLLEFSSYLKRAPHIKGMVKLFLIAIFPWLIFLVFAGKWKVLVSWWMVYLSVLLWTPIWTLLYHLMTSIAMSPELLASFGRASDGISLYSANFISLRMYQFYAIYSWLQILLGPLPTVLVAWGMFGSFLRDKEVESAPEVSMALSTGASVATGGIGAGAITATKEAITKVGKR